MADASHLIVPKDAGTFATKKVALGALGCSNTREGDAVLKDLGIVVFKVGDTEFVREDDINAALAERRRIALGIPTDAEAVELVRRRIAAGEMRDPAFDELNARFEQLQKEVQALLRAAKAPHTSKPSIVAPEVSTPAERGGK